VARRLLWASLALAPITWIVDAVAQPGKTALFVLSALSLVPLAWLIGEATEHAGEHTGARIGGLLNASFGNAPEVIIALIAIADNLPDVVRGSLAGSVVSNILLVLGAAMVIGEGLSLTLGGLVLGIVVAAAVSRVIGSLLFGVSALDPITIGAVLTVLLVVAALASYVPARRAARVDPLVAMRGD